MHVAVIGSGIVGSLTAYYLAERGMHVTLIDQNGAPAQEASAANASLLSFDLLYPIGSPKLLKDLPRIILGQHPRIKICRYGDPKLWRWALELLFKNCTPKAYNKNQKYLFDLAAENFDLMADFQQKHTLDFNHKNNGRLNVYTDAKAFEAEARNIDKINTQFDKGIIVLSADECLKAEPVLEQRQHSPIVGGIFSKNDCIGDSEKLAQQLCSEYLAKNDNVTLKFNTRIQGLNISQDRVCNLSTPEGTIKADHYIICNGAWAPTLLKPIGINLPIYPVRGQNLTFSRPDDFKLQSSITDIAHQIVMTPLGNRIRFSQGFQFDGLNTDLKQSDLDTMLTDIQTIAPSLDVSDYITHVGLRPYTPNSRPIVGKSDKYANLSFNLGHGMLGWTLAHATAFRCAENISE